MTFIESTIGLYKAKTSEEKLEAPKAETKKEEIKKDTPEEKK